MVLKDVHCPVSCPIYRIHVIVEAETEDQPAPVFEINEKWHNVQLFDGNMI